MAWGGETGEAQREEMRITLAHIRKLLYPLVRDAKALATKMRHVEKGPRLLKLLDRYEEVSLDIEKELNR